MRLFAKTTLTWRFAQGVSSFKALLPLIVLLGLTAAPAAPWAWNARYLAAWQTEFRDAQRVVFPRPQSSFEEPAMRTHNWIIDLAVEYLASIDKLPDGINPTNVHYLHYGAWFADHPWSGPPENEDETVLSVRDDLDDTNHTDAEFSRASCGKFRLVSGWRRNKPRLPNLFLQAYYSADFNPFFVDLDALEVGPRQAADNLYHFANKRKVRLAHMEGDGGFLEGDPIFENSAVGYERYAMALFELAKRFWPGHSGPSPSLDALPRISAEESGNLVMDIPCATWRHLRAKLPATFLGGNPFVCEGGRDPGDPCQRGRPTWPVWVASCASPSSPKTPPHSCDPGSYRAALVEPRPQRSPRAALIYLGWALHLLADAAVPDHVADRVGHGHRSVERDADRQLKRFARSFPLAAEEIALFDSRYRNRVTRKEWCQALLGKRGIHGLFADLEQLAMDRYKAIHVDKGRLKESWRGELAPTDFLVRAAAKQTAKALACF